MHRDAPESPECSECTGIHRIAPDCTGMRDFCRKQCFCAENVISCKKVRCCCPHGHTARRGTVHPPPTPPTPPTSPTPPTPPTPPTSPVRPDARGAARKARDIGQWRAEKMRIGTTVTASTGRYLRAARPALSFLAFPPPLSPLFFAFPAFIGHSQHPHLAPALPTCPSRCLGRRAMYGAFVYTRTSARPASHSGSGVLPFPSFPPMFPQFSSLFLSFPPVSALPRPFPPFPTLLAQSGERRPGSTQHPASCAQHPRTVSGEADAALAAQHRLLCTSQ